MEPLDYARKPSPSHKPPLWLWLLLAGIIIAIPLGIWANYCLNYVLNN